MIGFVPMEAGLVVLPKLKVASNRQRVYTFFGFYLTVEHAMQELTFIWQLTYINGCVLVCLTQRAEKNQRDQQSEKVRWHRPVVSACKIAGQFTANQNVSQASQRASDWVPDSRLVMPG